MPNKGMLLSPEFHQMLTLTLAERLETRELQSGGKITRERRADARRTALIDAERAIAQALDNLADGIEPVRADTRSLADLIAAVPLKEVTVR